MLKSWVGSSMFGPSKHRARVSFYFSAWVIRKNIVLVGIRRQEFGLGSVPAISYLTFFPSYFIF